MLKLKLALDIAGTGNLGRVPPPWLVPPIYKLRLGAESGHWGHDVVGIFFPLKPRAPKRREKSAFEGDKPASRCLVIGSMENLRLVPLGGAAPRIECLALHAEIVRFCRLDRCNERNDYPWSRLRPSNQRVKENAEAGCNGDRAPAQRCCRPIAWHMAAGVMIPYVP